MKSLGAAVLISNGSPPADQTASLTIAATESRWRKQIASSDELLTTAIFGFSRSSSVRPSAFHIARRDASRTLPGSKLLRSVVATRRILKPVELRGVAGRDRSALLLVERVVERLRASVLVRVVARVQERA